MGSSIKELMCEFKHCVVVVGYLGRVGLLPHSLWLFKLYRYNFVYFIFLRCSALILIRTIKLSQTV